tara:strand:+ start:10768 stop:11235 length:468 start_codon:yes stop_codon:yes gene_type:complete
MSTESEQNIILFMHEQSNACQKLKQYIPKDKKIQILDISQISNLPPQITSIPALIINNKEILLGKKVFDYFRTDDMDCINFNAKNSFNMGLQYTNLNDDNNNIESSKYFSSIDNPSMSDGVPKWEESSENSDNKPNDLEKLQNDRAELDNPIKRQ